MNLHHDKKIFFDILRATSQHLDIKLEFIEKDYWITLILNRLSKSSFLKEVVFKGGTSLSKGYNLIDRFSEDIDLAIIDNQSKTGNEIKTIIRKLEKEITVELTEKTIEGVTSKGSRFRKSVFEYESIAHSKALDSLILEINSFANPFPFQKLSLKSFIFDFLTQTNNTAYIEEYDLYPFEINVLNKEQTLLEKLVSLIRFSFDLNPIVSISGKIRHFYDLYYLANDKDCATFIASDSLKQQFDNLLRHDKELFKEPERWFEKAVDESPLITDFAAMWELLKNKYQTELTAYAYREIPDEKEVAHTFEELIKRVQ